MMCLLSSNGKCKQGSCLKIFTSRPKPRIPDLPDDCLNLIFKRLDSREDRNSFGLTCRQWFHIQNNNRESLWCETRNYPEISPENFTILLCRLLIRFQHLKRLSLSYFPEMTDFVTSRSRFFGSEVQSLNLYCCYTDMKFSLIFSWFPRLTRIILACTNVSDKGLDPLAKCCSSLETIGLAGCKSITDSGIGFLIKNCRKLGSLNINSCNNITGIGFLGCAHTLKILDARWCKLKPEGIKAMVSGGGLEYLKLAHSAREGSVDNESVITISKSCPLLKDLTLSYCKDVGVEAWEAIGQSCMNLEVLYVYGCRKLCDLGLQALCNGCNRLVRLFVDNENSCSSSALEHFKRERPNVMRHIFADEG